MPTNRHRTRVAASCAVAALIAGVAAFAPGAEADVPGRYSMSPAEGGMLRLDTATGAVSFCTRAGGDWSCAPVKDGEQVLRSKVQSLEAEVASLKDKLRAMDEIAGIGDPEKEQKRADAKPALPTEKDVEQAFDYLERMMKTLRERMQRLEGKDNRGTPL
ncbi:MAG: hypothetical protein K2Y05_02355 [Hyphomicrobiaceae bacterium]|nr:hypothetical protein [Hyphomicrobiaceae bacterium]